MRIALSLLSLTLVIVVIWACVVAVRQLTIDVARASRRPRFGLVDLLLLMTVICAAIAAVRWFWDTLYLGIALLLIPMVMPLAWLVKFWLEDSRLARERRCQRRSGSDRVVRRSAVGIAGSAQTGGSPRSRAAPHQNVDAIALAVLAGPFAQTQRRRLTTWLLRQDLIGSRIAAGM